MSKEDSKSNKEESPQENNSKNLISLENCDFSNNSNILNSPRSIEACLRLGVETSELYKLTLEEFKNKYPETKNMEQDLVKLRYDAEEKFRNDTIILVKEERNKIIDEINKKKNENVKNEEKNNEDKDKDNDAKKWEKMIEKEKKGIEKIKKLQRQNIESLITEQINKELIIKVSEIKEQKKKEKEKEAKKE